MNMKKLFIGIIVLLGLIIGFNEKTYAKQKPHIPGIRSTSKKSTQPMHARMQKKGKNDKFKKPKVSLNEAFGPQVIMEDNYGIEYHLAFSEGEDSDEGSISGTVDEHCCGSGSSLDINENKSNYNETNINIYARIPDGNTCDINGGDCVSYKYKGKFVENENGVRLIKGTWKNVNAFGSGEFKMWPKGVSGIVKDAKPIPGTTVTIVDLEEVPPYITDSNGFYQFVDVPDGTHTITASADGYQESSRIVTLTAKNRRNQVDFSLSQTVINQAPTVNAGPDQTVTLPNNASLGGTVTDDGLPNGTVTTTWSQISGPGTVTFADDSAVDTTASFSSPGTSSPYVLRLTADDGELTAFDEVTITVNPVPIVNQGPTVAAGSDQTVFELDNIPLDGTVSDDGLPNPPGTVTTTWTQVSGGGTVTFANPNAVDTTANFPDQGTYVLRLTADDGELTAFDEVTITVTNLVSSGNISGTVTDINSDAGIQSAMVSTDTGGYSTTTDSSGNYTLSNVVAGTYTLTASATGFEPSNQPVTVTAGGTTTRNFSLTPEITTGIGILTLSKNTAYLSGDTIVATVVDVDRNSSSSTEETLTNAITVKESTGTDLTLNLVENGVNSGTFLATFRTGESTDATVVPPVIKAIQEGGAEVTYTDTSPFASTTNTLSFSSSDATLYFDKDTYSLDSYALVTLIDAERNTSITTAQSLLADVSITSTSNSSGTRVRMVETGLDTGTFQGSIWIASSGGTLEFSQIQAAEGDTLTISYIDEVNTTGSKTVIDTASVLQPTSAPQVNAGVDQTITLPNSATLDGTVTYTGDYSATWTMVSGPSTVTFANAKAEDTTASFSEAGKYVLQLTAKASDSGLTGSDTVNIQVLQAANQAPQVDAGYYLFVYATNVILPLDGTVTDDGLPNPPGKVTTLWTKVSGPGDVTFMDASAVDTSASFSSYGVYVLRLTANDSELTNYDDVYVSVIGYIYRGNITAL